MPVFKTKPVDAGEGVYKIKPTLNGEGGGSGVQKFIVVDAYPKGSESGLYLTMQVDVDGIQTFDDIFHYLETKGFIREDGESIGVYPVVGSYNMNAVTGIGVSYRPVEEGDPKHQLTFWYLVSDTIRTEQVDANGSQWVVTITYLGE